MKLNRTNRSGVAAVEFALTVPFLFLFLFATYELGRANMIMHTTEAAAYEAARLAIVPGADASEVEQAARAVLATSGIRNAVVNITPANIRPEDPEVSVEISVSFKDNTLIAPLFMKEDPVVRSCAMTRETL